MAYIDYDGYIELYGGDISASAFGRYAWGASRMMDNATTGIDGYAKLRNAPPTEEYDAEAVKRCCAALIHTMHEIDDATDVIRDAKSFMTREDGTVTGKLVTAISSGSESVTYSTNAGAAGSTAIDKAVADAGVRDAMCRETIESYLSGICDANGVKLLYMGRYPDVR